uniref:protein-serine/threonine phosphatase n=1 Tax=Hordeum vulgare subsp. vulgare TaxID=112509 RepID=A0A8I6YA80_HORVV
MKMFSCFGIRTRPAQPALAKDQSVVGINNVPAAGDGCHLRSPVGKEAEGSGALVRAAWRGAYGAAGKSREHGVAMQDTVSMRPSFCTWVDGSRMHFFAVFDGHGGPVVSALLRDHMHAILAEELTGAAAAHRKKQHQDEGAEVCAWKGALRQSFARADELAASAVPRGTIMGSTAVVALVVGGRILVANCGDSRAVLCRAGRAVPLSQDHKQPARPDEMAAGGVMHHNDGPTGSRALGITITARSDDDDCLILASNGLWDVISNQKACCVAPKCLENKSKNVNAPAGKEQEVRCVCAAIRLTNLAINEHSLDDINVVVLDLKVA